MLHINIGYECGDRLHCDKCKQCKHKGNYKFHNLSVSLHIFFEYRLHIKLPHLLYIGKKWERLSGTDKCPFHKERYYNCYDCKYVGGELLSECKCEARNNTTYKERLPYIHTKDWGKRCAYFEKCAWADDYKNT
jgi:hypothetical protein